MGKYSENELAYPPTTESKELEIEDLERDFEKRLVVTVDERLEQSRLDPLEEIVEEENLCYLNGNPYGTKGNISTHIGKAKSKKSMLGAGFVAALLEGETEILGFKSGLGPVKGIIFDTEQSKRHSQLQYRRISKLADLKICPGLTYYILRPYTPAERLDMIQKAIYSDPDITFVVIDGIADLLPTGVNDEEKAIEITGKLMKWSLERNIHIMTVLHQNKSDSNAKGHIGSYLMQKSETVLSIERDTNNKEISIVTSPFTRGMEIEEMYFSVDDHGIPFLVDEIKNSNKARSKDPFDYELQTNWDIISQVFKTESEITYKNLNEKIRYVLGKNDIKVGERKCRDWITYFKEEKMIIQEIKNKPYKLNKEWQGSVAWHP